MKLKIIKLKPTLFSLDIWEHKGENISKDYCDHYDLPFETLPKNFVDTVTNREKEIRLTLVVEDLNLTSVLLHELIHVLFHLSKLTGLKVNYNSQEWVAYFIENLYCKIMK